MCIINGNTNEEIGSVTIAVTKAVKQSSQDSFTGVFFNILLRWLILKHLMMAAIIVCSINNRAFIKQDRDGIINKKEKSLRLEQNLLLQKNNFQSNN